MLFCCMRLAGDLEAAVRGGAREVAAGGGGQEPPGGGEQAEGGGGAGGQVACYQVFCWKWGGRPGSVVQT